MKKNIVLTTLAFCIFTSNLFAQVGIGTTAPNASAMLDITSTNKGLLIPRVNLISLTDATTIANPLTSLLVYNTNSGLTGGSGYYYNSGSSGLPVWTKLATGTAGTGWLLTGNSGTDTALNFLGTTDNKSLLIKVNNVKAGYVGAPTNDGNIFWGYQSGINNTGYSNVGVGINSLFANTTISNLVALGDSSLYSNTIGDQNTAVGSKALFSNTQGYANTATGQRSLYANSTGSVNTADGVAALYSNTIGTDNVANGFVTLYSNTACPGLVDLVG